MENSNKATLLEKSLNMYSLNDDNITTWIDWLDKFLDTYKTLNENFDLGWEIVPGPGTSLGVVFPNGEKWIDINNVSYNWDSNGEASCSCDCDWTQINGVPVKYQNSILEAIQGNFNFGSYPLYNGWFYGLDIWSEQNYPNGIDRINGRFDIIIYMTQNNSQEKIGIRIKYPVCSIGHNVFYTWGGGTNTINSDNVNFLYTVPAFTLYSSIKGNLTLSSSPNWLLNNYCILFGPQPDSNIILNNYKLLIKAGLRTNEQEKEVDYQPFDRTEAQELTVTKSPIWSLECQNSIEFYHNYDGRMKRYPNDSKVHDKSEKKPFKIFWKNYNKFNYHYSASGNTLYFYISNQNDEIGIKIIITTLENDEKAIMIARNVNSEENTICACLGYTESFYSLPTQDKSNYLITAPTRPYIKLSSGIGQFSLSRALLPGQKELCKDLYFVTKRDTDETIGIGEYILVRDKDGQSHHFRVVPFGSQKTYEVENDNTTYLAFPVADPTDTGD